MADDDRLAKLEAALSDADQSTNGTAPEFLKRPEPPINDMRVAVERVAIEEVPEIARKLAQSITNANDRIAAHMEEVARMLLDKSAELRQGNDIVCDDIKNLIRVARQYDDLTKSTEASYRAALGFEPR